MAVKHVQKRIATVLFACLFITSGASRHKNEEEDYLRKIAELFEYGGAAAVKMFLDSDMNEWRSQSINIAVIGQSGSGKSSFINAILGLTADDKGSADVGVVETTREIQYYPHPRHDRMVLWDVPGVGSTNFIRAEYFNKVQVERFDYFILITSDRFREDDLWLARELERNQRLFYFVRNKIGQDVANNLKSHPKTHDEGKVIDQIRQNCKDILNNAGMNNSVYLVDSYETEKFDFDVFTAKLVADAPVMSREALVLSMSVLTESIISAKEEALFERIHKVAILSALAGSVPVPFLDAFVDAGIMIEEAQFYRQQFGLDEKALADYAIFMKIRLEDLEKILDLKSTVIKLTTKELLRYFTKKGTKAAATWTTSRAMKYILPVFGNAMSGGASYAMTKWCLDDLIHLMAEDARKILRYKTTYISP